MTEFAALRSATENAMAAYAERDEARAENERLREALAEAVHFLGCTMRNGIDLPNRSRGYNRDRAWAFLREHEVEHSAGHFGRPAGRDV